MTREEFVDKVGVAARAIKSASELLNQMERKKSEATYIYIKENKLHSANDRVRVYKLEEGENLENKEQLGIGYVDDVFVDEVDGLILYQVSKEVNKERSGKKFFEEFAADISNHSEYNMLIEKI